MGGPEESPSLRVRLGLRPAERFFWPLAALLLAFLLIVQVASIRGETQTWDEAIHLTAGYSYFKTGDYRLNKEHPPLGKLLNALPLLYLNPRLPLNHPAWQKADAYELGFEFLYHNTVPADTMLFAARCVTIFLTLVLGIALAWWTKRAFGAAAGMFALALYVFDPNITAHGRYVTSDLLATLFFFLTCIAWDRYLSSRRRLDLAIAGVTLGLALSSKFSAVLLVGILPFLYLLRMLVERGSRRLSWKRFLVSVLVVNGVALAVVAGVYAPETKRISEFPRLKTVVNRTTPAGKVLYWFGKQLRLPAHPYFVGIDMLASHDKDGQEAYLMGQYSDHGWWYYFPVVIAVKTPVAVLFLFLLALVVAAYAAVKHRFRGFSFKWVLLTVPPAIYLGVSMSSHLNLGVRHILPIYPFLYALTAGVLFTHGRMVLKGALPVLVAVACSGLAIESLSIYPHYLAFFNIAAGGPENGPAYLVDSNIDWGQDVKKLKAYMAAHNVPEVCSMYFGNAPFWYYGIGERYLPRTQETEARNKLDCVVAISATVLHDLYVPKGSFAWLRERKPTAKIGYSIYIYDLRKSRRPSL